MLCLPVGACSLLLQLHLHYSHEVRDARLAVQPLSAIAIATSSCVQWADRPNTL